MRLRTCASELKEKSAERRHVPCIDNAEPVSQPAGPGLVNQQKCLLGYTQSLHHRHGQKNIYWAATKHTVENATRFGVVGIVGEVHKESLCRQFKSGLQYRYVANA